MLCNDLLEKVAGDVGVRRVESFGEGGRLNAPPVAKRKREYSGPRSPTKYALPSSMSVTMCFSTSVRAALSCVRRASRCAPVPVVRPAE